MSSTAYLEQSPLVQIRLELGRLEPHDDRNDDGRCDQRGVAKVQKYAIEVVHVQERRSSGHRVDGRDGGVPERCAGHKSVHRGSGHNSLSEDACESKVVVNSSVTRHHFCGFTSVSKTFAYRF